ncbi:type VI secretion system tube protein Hcp [Marivita sp. XM-24bin2]|jgi:type VI secretion system secreted protein Hcp|uniref:Hcp family type VI secretion system effector n=1 Tax=unclassified Marivita TaxID=2632480 RepID=UPI000D79EC86|nr:type VI secretion system tube protein Hcp [Marivita sp. XM-24bin2]MCR9108570.1 type VI secretion system tube protein Hcp [Paracoccaceae bacterium]PWL36130.1 MAG: type VI secretion system tube protein Hcp [Marivita sp. XM-24bin2]
MAVDMFLDLKGIPGESKDDKHKDKIDVLAWSWGCSQSGTMHFGGGGGAGKANFQDISVTKWIDKASPILMTNVATGDHIAEGTLIVRKAGAKPLEYIKITMTDILVTSVSTGGSGGEDRLTENVSLNFAQIKFEYKEQKKDGSGEAAKVFDYNIEANKKN